MTDLLAMQRAVWRSKRSTTEKIVMLAILDHYSATSPEPWPSVTRIGAHCGLGRTAVLDALASLERSEVLVVRRVSGCTNQYDLSQLVMRLEQVDPADPPPSGPRGGARQSAKQTGPVRAADQPAAQTRPAPGHGPSAMRTEPVRLAAPKEPKKEPIKEPTVVRAHARPDPALPLVERARLVLRDPRAAEQLRPQDWEETGQIAAAYGYATGSRRPLSELQRDRGLRAIVELLAAGFAVEDVTWVASSVPHRPWWRSGERIRGLGSLSIEVVSRAIAERDAPPRPTLAKTRGSSMSDEERRIHRNTLLENASAGWYGAEFRRTAMSGNQLRALVDELECLEALGQLRRGGRCPDGSSARRMVDATATTKSSNACRFIRRPS
jgi:hypothetical protein